jgi:hypothetical protein
MPSLPYLYLCFNPPLQQRITSIPRAENFICKLNMPGRIKNEKNIGPYENFWYGGQKDEMVWLYPGCVSYQPV